MHACAWTLYIFEQILYDKSSSAIDLILDNESSPVINQKNFFGNNPHPSSVGHLIWDKKSSLAHRKFGILHIHFEKFEVVLTGATGV